MYKASHLTCLQLCFKSFPSSCCQDDPPAMDFVTAAANLRMNIFSMNMKSRFDVKCKFLFLDARNSF